MGGGESFGDVVRRVEPYLVFESSGVGLVVIRGSLQPLDPESPIPDIRGVDAVSVCTEVGLPKLT